MSQTLQRQLESLVRRQLYRLWQQRLRPAWRIALSWCAVSLLAGGLMYHFNFVQSRYVVLLFALAPASIWLVVAARRSRPLRYQAAAAADRELQAQSLLITVWEKRPGPQSDAMDRLLGRRAEQALPEWRSRFNQQPAGSAEGKTLLATGVMLAGLFLLYSPSRPPPEPLRAESTDTPAVNMSLPGEQLQRLFRLQSATPPNKLSRDTGDAIPAHRRILSADEPPGGLARQSPTSSPQARASTLPGASLASEDMTRNTKRSVAAGRRQQATSTPGSQGATRLDAHPSAIPSIANPQRVDVWVDGDDAQRVRSTDADNALLTNAPGHVTNSDREAEQEWPSYMAGRQLNALQRDWIMLYQEQLTAREQ